ncbi:DNA repair protein RecO [Leucobacter chinensis]|uniref:DNA repair protein RecO n=1 Tax=Leucobacter chinensis TaxID=2851010 RepID=UPI001C21AEAA|nr:DNA repair protein RecO [Leucobacter chinensis]
MAVYRDQGIVLRTHKLGEADRIITMFLRERGVTRLVAKGVRKTSSKFGGRLEPFMLVDIQAYEGRSLDTITQAVTLQAYTQALAHDYDRYSIGSILVETSEKLAEDGGGRAHFNLLLGALRTLAEGEIDPELVRDAYLIRAIALSGWAAGFVDCVVCEAPGPHQRLSVQHGGVLCERCGEAGIMRVTQETPELLAALFSGDWPTAIAAGDRARKEAASFAASYTQWHLERGLKSMRIASHSQW